uniref:Major facilitator superfamily (MFS) profile domain-containing protein n=1 Tax=Picea sitchensis TaxID=3332 RepID=A9NW85_PICSI|nr:unknown [Picea sitchensis]
MEEDHSSSFTSFVGDGSVDLHGRSVSRAHTGRWKASLFIIGVEMAERFAYAGILANLVIYLTDVMDESTATAAKNVNVWTGVASMLPFLGAFVADSYLGRYWTIALSSVIYLLGLILVTLSASLKSLNQIGFFFFSIYLVALGQGGHKPCLEAFGADQFEEDDPIEKKHKSSFFNYWYCGICIGSLIGVTVLVYIQDNVGWDLGFGIPAMTMAIALFIFLCGTRFYRHKLPGGSPLTRIIHVFVATFHKWNVSTSHQEKKEVAAAAERELLKFGSRRQYLPTDQFRFLDKATIEDKLDYECKTTRNWRLCTVEDVEDVKAILGLSPIWMSCLIFGVVFAQSSTFFTKQGATMDRKIGKHFEIPAASLQGFISLSIILLLPVYDRIFVPNARKLTGNERGITFLQRIGTGMFISILSMIVAALAEIRRIKAAKDNGLIDMPEATIPLSISLLLPQYILFGIADVFTMVGLQEYFYDQMPDTMKTLGIAVYLSVFGVGSFLSSIIILVTEKLGGSRWFVNNLNKAHLDYFYWLLASLSAINFFIYMFLASRYKYKNAQNNISYQEESCRARTLLPS